MKKIDIQPEKIFCPQPMYIIGTYNEDNQPSFSVIYQNFRGSIYWLSMHLGCEASPRRKVLWVSL